MARVGVGIGKVPGSIHVATAGTVLYLFVMFAPSIAILNNQFR